MKTVDILGPSQGYTLLEMMVALSLSVATISAVYSLYIQELKAHLMREEVLDIQQQARVVIDLVTREILMAGYDPRGVNRDTDPTNDFDGIRGDSTQLTIKADLNGNGLTSDANETIVFVYDGAAHMLRRNTGGGNQPFGENIESFTVGYFDQVGKPTEDSKSVRQVEISLTARVTRSPSHPLSKSFDKTVQYRSRVTLRNVRS